MYLKKLHGGLKEWPGVQIIFAATRIGGTWSNWYDTRFKCGGFNAKDFFCVKGLDDQFAKYLTSADRAERKQLAERIQRTILEELCLPRISADLAPRHQRCAYRSRRPNVLMMEASKPRD